MTVAITVDNRIRIALRGLPDDAAEALRRACTHMNPEFLKRKRMGYATWKVPAEIRTWSSTEHELSLPRGVMARVRAIFSEHGLRFRVVDARVEGAPLLRPPVYVGHEPRDYQHAATSAILAREQGVVRASTGSGKTTTMLYAASRIGLNTLVVLPSVKLLDQTVEVAEKLLRLDGGVVGVVRGGTKRLRPLTVATQQTLWRRTVDEDVRAYFGAVMIDEAHHAAASTFQDVIDQFPCRYRVAFTADERRRDRKEFLVYDAFGDVLHETTRAECEAKGAIVDVEVRVVLTRFRDGLYQRDANFGALVDRMAADPDRNSTILDIVREEVSAGEQVIVCTHRREHARELQVRLIEMGVSSGQMLGGAAAGDVRDFAATRAGLRSKRTSCGVGTYEALGEGIDLPAVAVGIAATPITANKQRFNQYRGRLCRPSAGKTHGRLYVMLDHHVLGERALANVLAWNRTVRVRRGGRWVDARALGVRAIIRGA